METIKIEIPAEYKELFTDWWREAAIYGGRYSLKSHTVARYLLIRARQQKTRVLCCREFQTSIKESSHQLLADLIEYYGLNDFTVTDNSIINKETGSDFLFKGLWNNEQGIKSTEGVDIAWVEEAQTVSNNSLEVLTPTVRKDNSKIIYTYNRLLEEDPVHKRLVIEGRPNTLIINHNYDIAEKYGWMPDVIKQEMEDDKEKRPALYEHKWLGKPESKGRRIYTGWECYETVPKTARLERYGLNFGYSAHPLGLIALYYYNGGYIVDQIMYGLGYSNRNVADMLKNLEKALVIADSEDSKSIEEIRGYRINIIGSEKKVKRSLNLKAGTKKKYKKWSIQIVQNEKIGYTKRSVDVEREYQNFLWMTDPRTGQILDEPEEPFHYSMDAIKYAVCSLAPVINKQEYINQNFLNNMPSQTNARPANPAR